MKKITIILTIICLAFFNVNAISNGFHDGKSKPGDDKKSKAKREDTTKFVINLENVTENEEESPDTNLILFPSHDLYASWDTLMAHPYKFNESFKSDSVVIQLIANGDGGFSMPIKGPLTSVFGWRKYRPHYGTDIDLETGDQIVSAFDGMVRLAKYCQGYGNCVIVRHNNGLETVYGHLSRILVEPGQTVNAGELIGLGGNTGRSSGSHLHLEFRYLGQALDTEDFIDYEKGELKTNEFVLRKIDVENKYDLRALHNRHKKDIGYSRASNSKSKLSKGGYYKVRKGDNLGKIAKRYHTSVKVLCKKNRLKPNSVLRLGQRIKI